MAGHYCNAECIHNFNDNQICDCSKVFHVDRYCVTFRKRPKEENYRELMKVTNPNCVKGERGGGYKTSKRTGILK